MSIITIILVAIIQGKVIISTPNLTAG